MLPMMRRNFSDGWLPSMFNTLFDDEFIPTTRRNAPQINVREDENGYNVEVAAPGMNKEDLKLELNPEENLVITMEKKTQNENKAGRYLRRDFSLEKFTQTLILPQDARKEDITASMSDGILTIMIPKIVEETPQPRQITIN